MSRKKSPLTVQHEAMPLADACALMLTLEQQAATLLTAANAVGGQTLEDMVYIVAGFDDLAQVISLQATNMNRKLARIQAIVAGYAK